MKTYLAVQSRPMIYCLVLIQLLAMAAMEMSGPFWPLFFQQINSQPLNGLSPTALALACGLVYAGPMLTAMLFTPLWGRLGDRLGYKRMLVRALLALAITQFWIAGLHSIWLIVLVRLIQGALGGFIAASQAYGCQVTSLAQRAKLMAKLQSATAIGSLLGPMLGGWLFDDYRFASVNVLAAVICLGCLMMVAVLLPSTRCLLSLSPKNKLKSAEVNPSVWRSGVVGLLIGIVLVQAGKMLPQPFLAMYVSQVMHAPSWMVGLSYGMTALGLCLSASVWARRFAKSTDVKIRRDIERVLWACVLISILQAMSTQLLWFQLIRLCWGICLGALLPVFYLLLSRTAGSAQGYMLGLGNSAAKAGALIGTGIGAAAMLWLPVSWLFWVVVGMYVLAAVGMRLLRLFTRQPESVQVVSAG